MTEKPIIFSGPMVRAILDGRKTMTRRVVKLPADGYDHCDSMVSLHPDCPGPFWRFSYSVDGACRTDDIDCPCGTIGDLLWVRETWQQSRPRKSDGQRFCLEHPTQGCGDLHYAADTDGEYPPRWRSPIHMPRWASRITLEITGVRVERLQEITEDDAKCEGCLFDANMTARQEFEILWNQINGKKHPWESNPWVWVVEFKKV